jgi:lipoprotein-anchoring transpeptidase ErfK/SrfK
VGEGVGWIYWCRRAWQSFRLDSEASPPAFWAPPVPGPASEQTTVLVSISAQRLWLLVGEKVLIDSPISTGKRAAMTPLGQYAVLEKDPDHRSNLYGAFVDGAGRIVRDGISSRLDSAPSGTRFRGSPMKWFLRLTHSGIGLHTGHLPGYPASHGCVRLPESVAEKVFRAVKIGTPVSILP